ncbi:MAG: hypothetical protein ACKVP7_17475 [Hyphomicrobiaceae bacterium]
MRPSLQRWLLAAAALAIVAGLLVWQWRRERLIADCLRTGGAWDGPASRCMKAPPSPILRRGIERG